MTLTELKNRVDAAIALACEYGESADGITVSLQVDSIDDVVWSGTDVELHYDGNLNASGCVLTASYEK